MWEYAISCGEGTLIEHGIVDIHLLQDKQLIAESKGYTMIYGPASEDCLTGV